MRRMIAAALGLWLALGGIASAQSVGDNPVVVELYTSQGCSSCPPADKILAAMAGRDDVIALALHVDYWDYLGWKDSFGDPQFSKRQRAYARFAGVRTVYTPQMIVGGMDHLIGVRHAELEPLIRRHHAKPAKVDLRLARQGGDVHLSARSVSALPRGAVVQLVRYKPSERVEIKRGENTGRTVTYVNIVTEWRQVADWDGASPLDLSMDAGGADPVVVIVQEPGPGPILAAARLQ